MFMPEDDGDDYYYMPELYMPTPMQSTGGRSVRSVQPNKLTTIIVLLIICLYSKSHCVCLLGKATHTVVPIGYFYLAPNGPALCL